MVSKLHPERFDYDGECCRDYSAIGLEIARRIPIVGTTATEDECARRNAALVEALVRLQLPTDSLTHPRRHQGVSSELRAWYSTILSNGQVTGCWADSAGEAIINEAMWRGEYVVRVILATGDEHRALQSGRDSVEVTLW